jgi:hypothetical protein
MRASPLLRAALFAPCLLRPGSGNIRIGDLRSLRLVPRSQRCTLQIRNNSTSGSAPPPPPRSASNSAANHHPDNDLAKRPRPELSFKDQAVRFNAWRRQHIPLVVLGGVLGAAAMFCTTYVYILDNPKAIEKLVVNKTAVAFSRALTFDARRKVYAQLPEIALPVPGTPPEEWTVATWARTVCAALDEVESSWLLMTRLSMRSELVAEASKFPDLTARLAAVREVLPASFERDVLVQDVLAEELDKSRWLDAGLLEANPPSLELDSCDVRVRILIASIAYFPGPVNRLVQYLDDPSQPPGAFVRDSRTVARALDGMLRIYTSAIDSPKTRAFALQRALNTTIDVLPKLQSQGPYELYVRAIEDDLIGPLARDARVTEDILVQVKAVFLALPSEIQARVLLRALRHPLAKVQFEAAAAAEVIRGLTPRCRPKT